MVLAYNVFKRLIGNSVIKPQFDISENSIRIILPVIEQNLDKLTADEKKIYDILQFKALALQEN